MLGSKQGARPFMKTKSANPATKILSGFVERRRVRCGKSNCKCANGEHHTAFYHVWHTGGHRFRRYIRRSDVRTVKDACKAHRQLQARLRAGRIEYKQLMARVRILLGNV